MKRRVICIIIMSLLIISGNENLRAQESRMDFKGSWLGKISLGAVQLRIVFNIKTDSLDNLTATMDSPDQGAKDIPCGNVIVNEDSVRVEVPVAMGVYNGMFTDSDSIVGTWSQNGVDLELNIVRQEEEFRLNRPQEPMPPYPYIEEEVVFRNEEDGIDLGGTLTVPDKKGSYPAVVMITGSGSQNRDEEIFGHKPFKVIADWLTRKGVAVLRYDDRGVGKSGGTSIGATTFDFSKDVVSAFNYLESLEYIDTSMIGLIGHSEGGIIAQIVAAEYNRVGFIVSLAGPGVNGRTILIDQSEYISRLYGVADSTIKVNLILNNIVYDILDEFESPTEGIEQINKRVPSKLAEAGYSDMVNAALKTLSQQVNKASYPWLRYFILFDPADYLPKVKCPVLVLNGSLDCQVLAEKNVSEIRRLLGEAGNRNVETHVFDGLNHLFQHCTTGLVDEYGKIEETISPEVLDTISGWILKVTGK